MSSRSSIARPVGPPVAGVGGYEYGNTRLRARRSQLLDPAAFRELFATGSPERLLGALRATPYGPDVEHALVHHDPVHRLDAVVRSHLSRSLWDLRRFYTGRPARGIELLLGRWDLRNLLAMLRSKARPATAPPLDTMLVPAGNLDRAALAELSQQPSLRSTVELLVAWDIPSRSTARRLLRSWPDYESSGDPIVFEHALTSAWAEALMHALDDWRGTDLERVLRSEVDQINLIAMLRRRDDGSDAGASEPAEAYLAGGTIRSAVLDEAARARTTVDVVALLHAQRLPSGWDAALARWIDDDDVGALAGRLERSIAHTAIGLFVHGDPLGIAVPIAFTWAKECEARNVRLVGRAIAHRLDWTDIEQDLVA